MARTTVCCSCGERDHVGGGRPGEAALPFSALIIDKDEVTLLLPAEACDEFSGRLRRARDNGIVYRLITFESELEPSLVGFIARVSAALATAEIPILTFAAYSRDHILVSAADFEGALGALQALQAERN